MCMFVLYRNTWRVELLMINSNTWNHLTMFKQINYSIELLVFDSKTLKYLILCKQMINIK